MGKAFRHPQLAMVVGGQPYRNPLAEVWRAAPDIDSHIQHFTVGDTHQLALGVFQLIVQPAQHTLLRARMVVLDKGRGDAGFVYERLGVEALIEKTAAITEHVWFDDQHAWQVGSDDVH
ncbi:hypothetical protein D3C72_1239120 [compost metagenome]